MEIQKGEWYFCVQCRSCDATIYFSHDPSRGKIEVAAYEDSFIRVNCPGCRAIDDYRRDELVSREVKYI